MTRSQRPFLRLSRHSSNNSTRRASDARPPGHFIQPPVTGKPCRGSRYLNSYFGSGIYTWTGLILTVLAALTAAYFLGGFIADRTVSAAVLGMIVGVASVYLLVLPSFADAILRFVLDTIDNVRLGSLYAALETMCASAAFTPRLRSCSCR